MDGVQQSNLLHKQSHVCWTLQYTQHIQTDRDLICTRISNLVKLKGKLLFPVTFCYGTFSLTCFATAKLSSADFFLFPFLPHYQSTLIRVLSSVWFRLSCYLHYYEYSVVFNVAANTNFGPRWVALFWYGHCVTHALISWVFLYFPSSRFNVSHKTRHLLPVHGAGRTAPQERGCVWCLTRQRGCASGQGESCCSQATCRDVLWILALIRIVGHILAETDAFPHLFRVFIFIQAPVKSSLFCFTREGRGFWYVSRKNILGEKV